MVGSLHNERVPREVVESSHFVEHVRSLGVSVKRLDEVMLAVTWELAREPERGEIFLEGRPDLRVKRTASSDDIPPMRVLYTFDQQCVTLLALAVIPSEELT